MAIVQHLILHLQEMYVAERDFAEYLREWSGRLRDQQLKSTIHQEIEDVDRQVDNLRKALWMIGAFPNEDKTSPIVQALRQQGQVTSSEMPAMTPADADVHVAMVDIAFGQMEIGIYQGAVSMAEELGNREVVALLQKTLECKQKDVRVLQELLPILVKEEQSQQRAA